MDINMSKLYHNQTFDKDGNLLHEEYVEMDNDKTLEDIAVSNNLSVNDLLLKVQEYLQNKS